ncbi:MAG: hypothetical protein RRA92_11270, partial [Gemmatimonadota bacterium]|nr:hypothetical protein [Gemmatimonadota bacterium]
SPVHETDGAGRVWVYVEAYGLTAGSRFRTVVRLEPEKGEEGAFEIGFEGEGPADAGEAARGLYRLELGDSPPGAYEATLRVRDGRTGAESLPARFRVVNRRR